MKFTNIFKQRIQPMDRFKCLLVQRFALYGCGLILATEWFVGCTPITEQSTMVPMDVSTLAERIPFIEPTSTSLKVMPPVTTTFIQTPSPNPTLTPNSDFLPQTPPPIPSFIPTLTEEEEGPLIQELMATNGECLLPCWWGIELGTPLVTVGETFTNWGATLWEVTTSGEESGGITLGYYQPGGYSDPVDVFLQFYATEGIVQYMKISGSHESRQFGEQEFVRDWGQYFLPTILQVYGKPSLAYFLPGSVTEKSSIYALYLYYPDLGINIFYHFQGTLLDDNALEVCLRLEDVFLVQLQLYNPQFARHWPTAKLFGLNSEYDPWLIENQMDIDLNTFYETYQNSDNLGCFQIR